MRSDKDILKAVDRCWDRGDRHALEGGVGTEHVADELGMSPSGAWNRLRKLQRDGRLIPLDGVGPSGQHRVGYAPADKFDGEGATIRPEREHCDVCGSSITVGTDGTEYGHAAPGDATLGRRSCPKRPDIDRGSMQGGGADA